MVSSISSVSPANVSPVSVIGTNPQANNVIPVDNMNNISQDQYQNQYQNSDKYAMSEVYAESHTKKQGGFISFLGKLVVAAVVVGGTAALARKHIDAIKKIDVSEEHEKILEKAACVTAKVGDFVNDKIISPVVKFFKRS